MTKKFVTLVHLGEHMPGEVIHFTDEQIKNMGINIERLLSRGGFGKGSIREATAEDGDSVAYGDTDPDRRLLATPDVPDPLRQESPPTLPQEGYPDETTPAEGTVSDEPSVPKTLGNKK